MDILFITNKGEGLALAYTLAQYGHRVKFYNRHPEYDKQGAGIIDLIISWKPYIQSTDIVIIDDSYADTLDRNFPNAVVIRNTDFSHMMNRRYDRSLTMLSEHASIPTLPHTVYESPDMALDLMADFPHGGARILNTGQYAKNIHEYKYYIERLPSVSPVIITTSCNISDWTHVITLDWYTKGKWSQPTMYATNHLMWLPRKKHTWLAALSRCMDDVLEKLDYTGPVSINYRINLKTKEAQACRLSLHWDWNMIAAQACVLRVDPLKYLLGDYIGSAHYYPAAYWSSYNDSEEGFPCDDINLHIDDAGAVLPINIYYDGIYRKASSDMATYIQVMRSNIHDNPIGENFKKDLKTLKRLSLAQ